MPKNIFKSSKRSHKELPYEPPIWFGNQSNGEYFDDQKPLDRRMRKEILTRGEEISRKLGMDRRQFMASSMGAALTMSVINACGGSEDGPGSSGGTGGGGGGGGGGGSGSAIPDNPFDIPKGGPYVVTPEATCSPSDFLNDEYFIMDVQTHQFDDGEWRTKQVAYPIFAELIASCSDVTNKLDC
ncbi:MAG: hypothetical protein FJ104_07830, partial [Deltaproteobacteria bacterium]|nr:hypothetical protein [Deltaproteobacteria bacterium]